MCDLKYGSSQNGSEHLKQNHQNTQTISPPPPYLAVEISCCAFWVNIFGSVLVPEEHLTKTFLVSEENPLLVLMRQVSPAPLVPQVTWAQGSEFNFL